MLEPGVAGERIPRREVPMAGPPVRRFVDGIGGLLRSDYVHSGIPFPWQLYRAPQHFGGVPIEYLPDEPVVGAAHPLSKPRLNKTRPIHLHLFAHLVRGAILKWWRECSR